MRLYEKNTNKKFSNFKINVSIFVNKIKKYIPKIK